MATIERCKCQRCGKDYTVQVFEDGTRYDTLICLARDNPQAGLLTPHTFRLCEECKYLVVRGICEYMNVEILDAVGPGRPHGKRLTPTY